MTRRTSSPSTTSDPLEAGRYGVNVRNASPPPPAFRSVALDGGYIQNRTQRFARCILMNSPFPILCSSGVSPYGRREAARAAPAGAEGRRWRRWRRGERRWGGPEPEMAARWLLLALLAAHAAALPDVIRIGEYLSSLPSTVKRVSLPPPFIYPPLALSFLAPFSPPGRGK